MGCCALVNTIDRVCNVRVSDPGYYLIIEDTPNLDGSACVQVNDRYSEGGKGLTGKGKIEVHVWLVITCRITGPRLSAPSRCEQGQELTRAMSHPGLAPYPGWRNT